MQRLLSSAYESSLIFSMIAHDRWKSAVNFVQWLIGKSWKKVLMSFSKNGLYHRQTSLNICIYLILYFGWHFQISDPRILKSATGSISQNVQLMTRKFALEFAFKTGHFHPLWVTTCDRLLWTWCMHALAYRAKTVISLIIRLID